jgi:hypothetical protein
MFYFFFLKNLHTNIYMKGTSVTSLGKSSLKWFIMMIKFIRYMGPFSGML